MLWMLIDLDFVNISIKYVDAVLNIRLQGCILRTYPVWYSTKVLWQTDPGHIYYFHERIQ